jgi:hypothetical protein
VGSACFSDCSFACDAAVAKKSAISWAFSSSCSGEYPSASISLLRLALTLSLSSSILLPASIPSAVSFASCSLILPFSSSLNLVYSSTRGASVAYASLSAIWFNLSQTRLTDVTPSSQHLIT